MRSFCLLILVSLPLLQSCQHTAEAKAEQVMQAQKREAAASYNTQLGMGYLKQGDTPRAKRKLLTALELAPKSAQVNVAMAYYLEKTGDMAEAKTYYQKALSLAPDSGAQMNNYGTYLCRIGKYEEAESYFLKAVKDVNYINTAAAYENAGLCSAAIPDYPKAETYFIKALTQDPRRKQSLFELASIELKENEPEKALNNLQKYQELLLNDPTLLSMALDAAKRTGKSDIEADYMQRLSKLNNKLADYPGAKNEYDSSYG